MNQRHSSQKQNWITPPWIIEAARKVLGTIDLDPASSLLANQVVRASAFYDESDDGLAKPWFVKDSRGRRKSTSIWLNPPGGWHNKVFGDSEIRHWWTKTLAEQKYRYFGHMLWCAFSIEQQQVTQVDFPFSLLDFPSCVLGRRVAFINPLTGKPQSGMPHSTSIHYIPGHRDSTETFAEVFGKFGKVSVPYADYAALEARYEETYE